MPLRQIGLVGVGDPVETERKGISDQRYRFVEGVVRAVPCLLRGAADSAFFMDAASPVAHLGDPLRRDEVDTDTAVGESHREDVEDEPRVPSGADDSCPALFCPSFEVVRGIFPERRLWMDEPGQRAGVLSGVDDSPENFGDVTWLSESAIKDEVDVVAPEHRSEIVVDHDAERPCSRDLAEVTSGFVRSSRHPGDNIYVIRVLARGRDGAANLAGPVDGGADSVSDRRFAFDLHDLDVRERDG